MITKFLIILHRIKKPKDTELFFNRATTIILSIANILDVLAVLLMAYYVDKLLIVTYAVIMAMVIRIDKGEHYETFLECFISGILIYTVYALSSLIIKHLAVDLILGIVLAIWMVDFKSEKAQKLISKIFKRGKP